MAIAMLIEVPGLTQEQYEGAAREFNESGQNLGNPLIHLAGPMDGGFRIVEVWESQEAANVFYGSDLFRQVTGQLAQPNITTWSLHVLDASGLKQTS